MAGEHILKILIDENTRIEAGDRWLVCELDSEEEVKYTVYEHKPYAKKIITHLSDCKDEQVACRVLLGEQK